MRNTIKFCLAAVLIIASAISISSCNKFDKIDEYENMAMPTRIGVLDSIVNINVQGTEAYNVVTLNGVYSDWNVTSSEDWLTVAKGVTSEFGKEELTVKVSATPNTFYSRTAIVTVKMEVGSSTVSKTFKVKQGTSLADPAVSLPESLMNFVAAATNKSITLTTNQSVWNATTTASWITLTKTGNSLNVAVTLNTGDVAREAVINIVAGTAPYTATTTLKINQAKPDDGNSITVDGIELILVKGGSFKMGAQNTDPTAANYGVAAAGSHYNANQSPIHKVTLSDYYIGKFLLTQAQWNAVMSSNPSKNVGNNNPVEYVDWNMATDFLTKLSTKTGKTFRLPTEAEWEYAARGGSKSNGYLYSGSNVASLVGNFIVNATTTDRDNSRTTPGGTFLPNELGIYDMSGNLYEWCSDYFGNYTADDQTNPKGPSTGTNRIIRGASWWHLMTTVYSRGNNAPTYTGTHANAGLTGFRVVYIP